MSKHPRQRRNTHKRDALGDPPPAPDALRRMCCLFHRDYDLINPPDQDPRAYAAKVIQPGDVAEVRAFLIYLLDGHLTAEQILRWWAASGAETYTHEPKTTVWLLEGIRDILIGRPARPNPGRGTYRHRR